MEFLQWFYGFVSKMTSNSHKPSTQNNPSQANIENALPAAYAGKNHLPSNNDQPLQQLKQYQDNDELDSDAAPTVAINLDSKKKCLFTREMIDNLEGIIQHLEAALVVQLKNHNELYDTIDDLTADRDLYYEKLRTIESIISCFEDSKFAQIIQQIITKEDLV